MTDKLAAQASRVCVLTLLLLISLPARAVPELWIADNFAQLGRVDIQTGNVDIIGRMSTPMDDIAFDPNGFLYGVGNGTLYSIDPATASTSVIGNLTTFVNSLVFDASGVLYAASDRLYTIDLTTGLATSIGNAGTSYDSSGDLAFVDGTLYLSAKGNASDDLYRLDTLDGRGTRIGSIGTVDVLGLASNNHHNLFGVADTRVLAIDPSTGSGSVLLDYGASGLGRAYGTAFTTEAARVSAPPPAGLLGLGILLITVSRFTSRRPAADTSTGGDACQEG